VFAEWVTAGAAFGIKAFFAVAVFGMFCVAIIGMIGLLSSVIKGAEDDKPKNRPY
jgi:hypothetical protein